jgi:hypothetical protein
MTKKRKVAVWLFAATSVISFIAALIPVVKGEGPRGASIAVGTIFLVLAIVSARGPRTGGNGPSGS